MSESRSFLLSSYLVAVSGVTSLFLSGSFGFLWYFSFLILCVICFRLEFTRFQLTEKVGTLLALSAIPIFLIAWQQEYIVSDSTGGGMAGVLAILIELVVLIKLAQKKTFRDWVFIYLVSFFGVLLAAALDVTPIYVLSLTIHIAITVSALLLMGWERGESRVLSRRRVPLVNPRGIILLSAGITLSVLVLAIPMFFALPRLGAAGLGQSLSGISAQSGFSDTVRLGSIGRIQLNDGIVLRSKVDGEISVNELRWRGVALDSFDHKTWSYSTRDSFRGIEPTDDVFLLKRPRAEGLLITQNIYLEPIDTPFLFAIPDAIAIQGGFKSLNGNAEDSYQIPRGGFERLNYRVTSIVPQSDPVALRAEAGDYSSEHSRYLQVPPGSDTRIEELASSVVAESGALNIYDSAKAIELHLQTSYGYTLEQKASGKQPLADFLFNVKEGHCEYFATAMAMMLRSQGIATRVVNGFQGGELNASTGFVISRQRDAHSWVEVLFPESNQWVAFDPTPSAGRSGIDGEGFLALMRDLTDTLETLWIQYFVSYDNAGQRSLILSSWGQVLKAQVRITDGIREVSLFIQSFLTDVSDDVPIGKPTSALGMAILMLGGFVALLGLVFIGFRKVRRLRNADLPARPPRFYMDLIAMLRQKGHVRRASQTPMEFANETGFHQVVELTEIYHEVRYGDSMVDGTMEQKIQSLLQDLRKSFNAS